MLKKPTPKLALAESKQETQAKLVLSTEALSEVRQIYNGIPADSPDHHECKQWLDEVEAEHLSLQSKDAELSQQISQLEKQMSLSKLLTYIASLPIYLFCLFPAPFTAACLLGIPLGLYISWANHPMTFHSTQGTKQTTTHAGSTTSEISPSVARLAKQVPTDEQLVRLRQETNEKEAETLITMLSEKVATMDKVRENIYYTVYPSGAVDLAVKAFEATGNYTVTVTPNNSQDYPGCTLEIIHK